MERSDSANIFDLKGLARDSLDPRIPVVRGKTKTKMCVKSVSTDLKIGVD